MTRSLSLQAALAGAVLLAAAPALAAEALLPWHAPQRTRLASTRPCIRRRGGPGSS